MKKLFAILALTAVLFGMNTASAQNIYNFTNNAGISIPTFGTATPSPSIINVNINETLIESITLTLEGFTHSFPDDLGAVLVGPGGQAVILFDGPGDGTSASGLTFTFTDSAGSPLSDGGVLGSGSFQPGQNQYNDTFTDAPAGPYGTAFSVYNFTNPNGDWSLYIEDFATLDGGSVSSWTLTIATVPEPATIALVGLGVGALGLVYRKRTKKRREAMKAKFRQESPK